MGNAESVFHSGPSTDLGIAVVVAESIEHGIAELLGDVGGAGDIVGAAGGVVALAVLDEELG